MGKQPVPIELLIEEDKRDQLDNRPTLEIPIPPLPDPREQEEEEEPDPRGVVVIEL